MSHAEDDGECWGPEPIEIPVIEGERREMCDKLLAKVEEIMGDACCGAQGCFTQAEHVLAIGDEDGPKEQFGLCSSHQETVDIVYNAMDGDAVVAWLTVNLRDRYDIVEVPDIEDLIEEG